MSERPDEAPRPRLCVRWLRCRRTGQVRSVAEHAACPYCFADAATIASGGRYEDFCTFDVERDPIHFGFPEDASRFQHG